MNISLTDALEEMVQQKVSSGLYNNASEVVREALRLLAYRDSLDMAKLERLKKEAALGFEALERGEVSSKSLDTIADEALLRHRAKGGS